MVTISPRPTEEVVLSPDGPTKEACRTAGWLANEADVS